MKYENKAIAKSHRLARAAGTMVGMAVGDALGAPYEFGPAIPQDIEIGMVGGGPFGWAPGEWTDDTDMAIPIVEACSQGLDITDPEVADWLVFQWLDWSRKTRDIGSQTIAVLNSNLARGGYVDVHKRAQARAQEVYTRLGVGRTGGTGALMRTSPLALGYLDRSETELAEAARFVAGLTHAGQYSANAVVLWTIAIRRAVVSGELNVRAGLDYIPEAERAEWEAYIVEAEANKPERFTRENGQVLGAFQGAWSAIYHTDNFVDAVEAAVRGGGDADTVAAIAGGLAGAFYGVAEIPARWRRILTGYGDIRRMKYRDLVNLAILASRGGEPAGTHGWPENDFFAPGAERTFVQHPHDSGVWLGSLASVTLAGHQVDAVVSMSRVGTRQLQDSPDTELIEFWLVDYPGDNLNAAFTLADAADTVAELRAEGKTVLIHCYAAHSRTPSTAAAYSIRHLGISPKTAMQEICAALPDAYPQPFFREILETL